MAGGLRRRHSRSAVQSAEIALANKLGMRRGGRTRYILPSAPRGFSTLASVCQHVLTRHRPLITDSLLPRLGRAKSRKDCSPAASDLRFSHDDTYLNNFRPKAS